MAAYGVSPVVTCLLSVADKNWRAPLSARQFPLQHPFLSATESKHLKLSAHGLKVSGAQAQAHTKEVELRSSSRSLKLIFKFAFMRKRSMLNGLTLNENDKSARIMPIAARIIILYIYSFTINLIITTYSTHMTLTL
ncbi:hypothetical protein OUZ56_033608 [Daphnia magna]|uniref:Uncharacterized protein n=1 Tax=Daphnia magna TaxID=35525 RepID=A0ABR0BAW1_9CRUS|nr:hypothetical protein OUZ56_033608 [Daphnia magna]